MSANLTAALVALTSTYLSLDIASRGLVVDAKEVSEALDSATPDTAEYIALQFLQRQNPYTQPAKLKVIKPTPTTE